MASIFLLTCIMLAFACNCKADLINDVCSTVGKPPKQSSCNQILRSDPHSSGADLLGLAKIAAAKSHAAAQGTKNIAKTYDSGSNKEKAETCIENCDDAIDELIKCINILKVFNKSRINDLQTYGSAALTDVGTCDDEFGSDEPASLKAASQKAQDSISALLAIFNKF